MKTFLKETMERMAKGDRFPKNHSLDKKPGRDTNHEEEGIIDASLDEVGIKPVSYTHLDVYKRQISCYEFEYLY